MFSVKNTWSAKAVSGIATASLIVSMFVTVAPAAQAVVVDECGSEFVYTKTADFSDSRVTINFESGDQQIDVSAASGYEVIKVELDVDNDNQSGYYTYATGAVNNLNPNPGNDINSARVTVRKTCNVTICHATGSGWTSISADSSALDGVGGGDHNSAGHQSGNDIIPPGYWDNDGRNWDTEGQAIYNNNCVEPPPTPPTAEEQCAIDEGFWNGESCEEIAECGENETYDSETNTCVENGPTPEEVGCAFLGGTMTEEGCDVPEIAICILIGTHGESAVEAALNLFGMTTADFDCGDEEETDYCSTVDGIQNESYDCPSQEELDCENGGGTWNGESCDTSEDTTPQEDCENDGGTWNSETETCTPAETPEDNNNDDNGNSNGDGGETSYACNERHGKERIEFINDAGEKDYICVDKGEVAGASTDMCVPLLTTFIRLGNENDPIEVTELQNFLNGELGLTNPITGIYDEITKAAVEQFHLKYASEVLNPWFPFGLAENTPTGYVYKTTQRMINNIYCASLNLPMPLLP